MAIYFLSMEDHVTRLAEWSCNNVREILKASGDHKKWIASFDGFYLTQGSLARLPGLTESRDPRIHYSSSWCNHKKVRKIIFIPINDHQCWIIG